MVNSSCRSAFASISSKTFSRASLVPLISATTSAAHWMYSRLLPRDQFLGGDSSISRQLTSLSLNLISLAVFERSGAWITCCRFRSILSCDLSSDTSSTTRRTSSPKNSWISCSLVLVSSRMSCKMALISVWSSFTLPICQSTAARRPTSSQGRSSSQRSRYPCGVGAATLSYICFPATTA